MQEKTKPIVFVVQEQEGKNLLPATKYGEIDVLLPPGQIAFSSQPVIFALNHKLQFFQDMDYLLLIGDPVLIGLASSIAAKFNNGKVKYLKWDKQEKTYFPIETDIG